MNFYVRTTLCMIAASTIAAFTAIIVYAVLPDWPVRTILYIQGPLLFALFFFFLPKGKSELPE